MIANHLLYGNGSFVDTIGGSLTPKPLELEDVIENALAEHEAKHGFLWVARDELKRRIADAVRAHSAPERNDPSTTQNNANPSVGADIAGSGPMIPLSSTTPSPEEVALQNLVQRLRNSGGVEGTLDSTNRVLTPEGIPLDIGGGKIDRNPYEGIHERVNRYL